MHVQKHQRLVQFAPATDEECRAASLQLSASLSGFTAPSKLNEEVFNQSVEDVFQVNAAGWSTT